MERKRKLTNNCINERKWKKRQMKKTKKTEISR